MGYHLGVDLLEGPGAAAPTTPDAGAADALVEQLASARPIGRPGRPAEIASAVLFLASDQSSSVTGSELFVDGGEKQH